jgi:hypothetical protein
MTDRDQPSPIEPTDPLIEPKPFDWDTYDRLSEELQSAYLAYDSYRASAMNLEYQGWDEHGVYPGEEGILNRGIDRIRNQIAELGEPPACVCCKGAGEVYEFTEAPTGERFFDEHPSVCWCCDGDGEYRKPVDEPNGGPAPCGRRVSSTPVGPSGSATGASPGSGGSPVSGRPSGWMGRC